MATGYCASCGDETELFKMLVEGKDMPHCAQCGAPVGPPPTQNLKTLDSIMLADDSALAREVIVDKLKEKKVAKAVDGFVNGDEFLTAYTKRLRAGSQPSLVIMDIMMPVINGANAMLALRSVERGFDVARPTPVLVFSSRVCDEKLREVLKHCTPSRYINKGASPTPDELADRLVDVIAGLMG